jgi:hypothetical protein
VVQVFFRMILFIIVELCFDAGNLGTTREVREIKPI